MRLANVDALLEQTELICTRYEVRWTDNRVMAWIDNAPTVDVAAVVRCKDCKHWCRNSGIAESPNGHCFHHDIETNGYDFCSYGAKMDGDVT